MLLDATLEVLLAIARILLLPFNLWVKAITNLSEQKAKGALNLQEIKGLWPFFSFCKRLFLDYMFDVIAFLSYPIGILVAVVLFVQTIVTAPQYMSFGQTFNLACASFIGAVIAIYVIPVSTAFAHNLLQLMLLPVRKFIDWCRKPAQHLDLTHENKDKKAE